MFKISKIKSAAQSLAIFAAAICLSACETLEADLEDTYTPATHYERYPIKVTRQPIKVSVSSMQGHVTPGQSAELANAGRRAHGVAKGQMVSIRRPSGGGKSLHVANEVKSILMQQGVPANKIVMTTYSGNSSSPVQVSFVGTVAVTEECGSWNNLAYQPNNEQYDNFGCAQQHNIAAMVANPQDLVEPQPGEPVDAGKTSVAIDAYRGYSAAATSSGGGSSESESSGDSGSSGDDSGGDSSGGDAPAPSE